MVNEIKVNIRYVEPTETDKIRERHYMRKFLEGVYDELEQKIKQSNEQGYGKKKQAAEMRSHVHESGFNDALQMQAHPAGS